VNGQPARTEPDDDPPGETPVGGDAPSAADRSPPGAPSPPTAHSPAPGPDDADLRLLRAMADLDNLRKRFEREVVREREAERARVAARWLPVVDDLDRALAHTTTEDLAPGGLADGLRAVRDHAVAVLAELGFPRFEDVGERFDPTRHEVVSTTPADAPPHTVVAVVRPGYGTSPAILRPATVVTSA
jgi:molecular chaperone GrpE